MVAEQYIPKKNCNVCREAKVWSDFYPVPSTGKPRAVCKICTNAAKRKGTAPKMAFTAIGKVCSKCGADKPLSDFKLKSKKTARYRSACRACEYQTTLSWNERNRDRVCVHVSRWKRKFPESVRAHVANRRASKCSAQGTHTAADIKRLLELQRGCCVVCRKPMKIYHVDHIMALVNGGTNDWTNLQLLHPRCNLRKSAKHPIDFMREQGFLL